MRTVTMTMTQDEAILIRNALIEANGSSAGSPELEEIIDWLYDRIEKVSE